MLCASKPVAEMLPAPPDWSKQQNWCELGHCCWTAMCTLRPCWEKAKIHLKCSRGLGCVTAALGSVSDPDDILSLDPPEDGLDLFMLTLQHRFQRKVLELMCWLSLYLLARSLIRVMEGWNCSLDIISVIHSSGSHQCFPLSPCYGKVWAMGNTWRCLLKQGIQPKPL